MTRRFWAAILGMALAVSACSGGSKDATSAPIATTSAEATSGEDAGEAPPETADGVGYCSFLRFEEIELALGVAPASAEPLPIRDGCQWFEEGNKSSLPLLFLQVADDAYRLDGELASRFEREIESAEISNMSTASVDGLGDTAMATGGPPPNAIAVVAGETFVQLIVNNSDLVVADTLESLARRVVDRL